MKKQTISKGRSNRQVALKKQPFSPPEIKGLIIVYSHWKKSHKIKGAYQKAKELNSITFNLLDTSKSNLFKQINKEVFYVL